MELSYSEAELEVQAQVRAFLAQECPDPSQIPAEFDARVSFLRAWQRRLHEAGFVGMTWPAEFGGRGAGLMQQIVVNHELAKAGAPPVIGQVGVDVVGPSIVAYGHDCQRAAYLDRILSAEEIWCQGFSEPGAGSDLASLRTRAVDAGDHFVLDGQKTWTSYVKHARWCAVLARTDPDAAAHRGISYLLVDLRSKGIETRTMRQVTGDPEFGEVFFDGVVVPKENLLGPLHGGWGIAMHTLSHERGPAAMNHQIQLRVLLDRLLQQARRIPRRGALALDDPEIRMILARVHIAVEVLRYQTYRSAGQAQARGKPGFESSVDKLVAAATEQQLAEAALDVLGAYSTGQDGSLWDLDAAMWQHTYLYGRAGSVFGGSAQIQRNIIAERILELPRSR